MALSEVGFVVKRQYDNHMILRRDKLFAQLVVPDHIGLDRGTLRTIIRQADLTVEHFTGLLWLPAVLYIKQNSDALEELT